jgi:hypothetical protein
MRDSKKSEEHKDKQILPEEKEKTKIVDIGCQTELEGVHNIIRIQSRGTFPNSGVS